MMMSGKYFPKNNRSDGRRRQEEGIKVVVRENHISCLREIKEIVVNFPGDTPLLLVFPKLGKCLVTDRSHWVEPNALLISQLEKICGRGSIKVINSFKRRELPFDN